MEKNERAENGKTWNPLKTLHVITEQAGMGTKGHVKTARDALEGGAKVIQLRDKKISDSEMEKIGRKLLEMTKKQRAMLIINDRMNVAEKIGADGIHLGKKDAPIRAARRVLGKKIIGASAGSVKEALQAAKEGADYVGFGPIFETKSKPDAGKPCGIEELKRTKEEFERRKIGVPLIAIGGICERNAERVMKYADGIAVISALSESGNGKETARKLLKIVGISLKKGNQQRAWQKRSNGKNSGRAGSIC